jgi:moderate conductance mechanosensitive channel
MPRRFFRSIPTGLVLAFGALAAARAQSTGGDVEHELGFLARIAAHVGHAAEALWDVLVTIPQIPAELARVFTAITLSAPAWLHPSLPLAVAATIALLVLAMPRLLHLAGGRRLQRWLAAETRFGRILRLIVFDAAAFLVSVALASLLVYLLFRREFLIGKFAVTLVGAAVRWRLSMLVPEILLRPGHPELRLIAADDAKARLVMRVAGVVLALGILFISVVPVMLAAGLALRPAQALALVVGTLTAAGAMYGVHRFFDGVLGPPAIGAQLLVVLTWLAWTAGVVMLKFTIYHGLVWSLGIIAATAAVDRLLALASEPAGDGAAQPANMRPLIICTLRRIVLAVAGTLVAGLVARLWLVDILSIVDREYWKLVREAVITALGVLVAGYVAYEVLRAWTRAKFGDRLGGAAPIAGDDEHAVPATRLSSVMPVLQGALGVVIIATAVLLALSHLGINVAPLIAGAGIFGLALSFGSQALVRDIVAGIFYMIDDAFRVGEYIEAGKHKGTVECIALRSVRLRHQNGQIHTLPYGQLGAVTNYSRDYATIKFNLRLARETDVEKVRKLVKKTGQEMLTDPELGKEFLQPLKMQGVADIQENALVCRFKFTVRPSKPTVVQREALKRLYRVFTEQGIAFASNAVVVQSAPGVPPERSAAARVAMMATTDRSSAVLADGS